MTPAAGVGGGHGLDVVGVVLAERDLVGFGFGDFGGAATGFVGWVAGYERAGRTCVREDRVVERLGGTGVDGDVVFWDGVLSGEDFDELHHFEDVVAAAFGRHGCDGGAGGIAWAKGVFVGVDEDGILRHVHEGLLHHLLLRHGFGFGLSDFLWRLERGKGEVRFGEDREGGGNRRGGQQEGAAGRMIEGVHGVLLSELWDGK